jgi:heat shock protein HtpX
MFGRITLFILTNILVIVMISIVFSVLGIGSYVTEAGLDYSALLVFCLAWGMIGSFISLALSRITAKWMMRVQVLDPGKPGDYHWYINTVHDLAKRAGLPKMPEVGIYQSEDLNAFATGPTKSRSLVAVSTGLLRSMSREEIEGVLGHEIAHIQNGDMVTMTLIQGVVNAFVMFLARVIAFFVSQAVEREEMRWIVNLVVIIVLQIAFGILGMMVTGWFSRKREFRADEGSAALTGRGNMIGALQSLQRYQPALAAVREDHASIAAFKISSKKSTGLRALLSTHPPLEDRIAALKQAK